MFVFLCEIVDVVFEREEGDMGCLVLGSSFYLVGVWRGMCMLLVEIRVFVMFGLRLCGFRN